MSALSTIIVGTLVLAPAPEGAKQATLTVDTSHVGEAGPIIRRRTEERGAIVLRDAGVLSGDDPNDPVIRVDVHEVGGEDPGFRLEVWIERKDEILVPKRTIECTLCTETEIVAKAEAEIVTLVGELPDEEASTPEPAVDEPAPDTGDPAVPPAEEADTTPAPATPIDDERRPLGPKGKAGIGLLAGGAVVAGVGIGLAVPGWKPLDDDPTRERSTRPIGIGVAAGGGVALITGAILLALDRRTPSGQRASLTPTVGWRAVGLTGRF